MGSDCSSSLSLHTFYSNPKREITKISNIQNTKRTYDQPSEQLFPKRCLLNSIIYIGRVHTCKTGYVLSVRRVYVMTAGIVCIRIQLGFLTTD